MKLIFCKFVATLVSVLALSYSASAKCPSAKDSAFKKEGLEYVVRYADVRNDKGEYTTQTFWGHVQPVENGYIIHATDPQGQEVQFIERKEDSYRGFSTYGCVKVADLADEYYALNEGAADRMARGGQEFFFEDQLSSFNIDYVLVRFDKLQALREQHKSSRKSAFSKDDLRGLIEYDPGVVQAVRLREGVAEEVPFFHLFASVHEQGLLKVGGTNYAGTSKPFQKITLGKILVAPARDNIQTIVVDDRDILWLRPFKDPPPLLVSAEIKDLVFDLGRKDRVGLPMQESYYLKVSYEGNHFCHQVAVSYWRDIRYQDNFYAISDKDDVIFSYQDGEARPQKISLNWRITNIGVSRDDVCQGL